MITGETGTGKSLLARIIHHSSSRSTAQFVELNGAAIPEHLLESELFGYERGAFTDARQSKAGLLQVAHRGTLFLDEVGLLPLSLQAKLLKVLEDGSVRRLGRPAANPSTFASSAPPTRTSRRRCGRSPSARTSITGWR